MRSTPIILDRIRHIKYDLQAIWDLDQLMTGGYKSILSQKVTPDLIKTLLWFGLKSEDPDLTAEDTGKLMALKGVGTKETALMDCFIICLQALYDDGWFHKEKEPESEEPQAQFTNVNKNVLGVCLEYVKLAELSGCTEKEAWSLSPIEIKDRFLTFEDYRKAENMERDVRMGTICATIGNASPILIKKSGGMFTWSDFVIGMAPVTQVQTPEIQKTIMMAAFGGM